MRPPVRISRVALFVNMVAAVNALSVCGEFEIVTGRRR